MYASHIFVSSCSDDESTGSSIPYIILTDSEAMDATLSIAPAPLSPDYVPASPDYTLDSDLDSETFEEDPQEADPEESSKEGPWWMIHRMRIRWRQMGHYRLSTRPCERRLICTSRKTVRPPFTLPPSIKAVIAKEITAPPHKRYRSPSSSSVLSSPSPSPSHKRYRSPSLPPQPPVPSSPPPPPTLLPPCKRFRMTSHQQETTDETTTEAIIPARLRKKSHAHRWMFFYLGPVHGETRRRVEAAEQQIEVLHDSLGIARDRITESQICIKDVEARLHKSEFREIGLKARLRRLEDRLGM
ncbi:hypothetical protein Tco_0695552 [Tanacetum coccineum]